MHLFFKKEIYLPFIIDESIINIVCNIFGLYAAYKELNWLILIYAGLKLLKFLYGIALAIKIGDYMILLHSSLFIIHLLVIYSKLLSKRVISRLEQQQQTVASQISI